MARRTEHLGASTRFARFARRTARGAGSATTFVAAVSVLVAWAAVGPLVGFSVAWQMAVNTLTTIVTFVMVFVIQNTQNRDAEATQLKLDELIRATEGTHNSFLDLEELTQAELDAVKARYEALAREAREELRRGAADTGRREIALPPPEPRPPRRPAP
jgi:low affinity Fe/Cu permease